MTADAEFALAAFPRSSRWWLTAALMVGITRAVAGDDQAAEEWLTRVCESAGQTGGWNALSIALSERTALAIRLALAIPDGTQVPSQRGDTAEADGMRVTPLRLGTGLSLRVSGRWHEPAAAAEVRRLVLAVAPGGVEGAAADPDTAGLIRRLVAAGAGVLTIDPYLVGGNSSPFARKAPPAINHYTCYNRSIPAERVQDIVTALAFLRKSRPGSDKASWHLARESHTPRQKKALQELRDLGGKR